MFSSITLNHRLVDEKLYAINFFGRHYCCSNYAWAGGRFLEIRQWTIEPDPDSELAPNLRYG